MSPFPFLRLCTNGFCLFLIHLTRQGFSTLTFWVRWFFVIRGCPVLCRSFSIYPLHASSTPHPRLYFQSHFVVRHCQECPLGKVVRGESKIALSRRPLIYKFESIMPYQRINFGLVNSVFFLFLINCCSSLYFSI